MSQSDSIPGHPIVSGINSILEPLLKYLDHFIKDSVKNTPTYVKDSSDFIMQLENFKIPEMAGFLTIDINSLYMNIPLNAARNVVNDVLSSHTDPSLPTHFLLDLLDICLEHNFFSFQSNFYLQVKGVAMGSYLAPSVANLFMINFEKCVILDPNFNPFYTHANLQEIH